jgi:putative copper resistance protein D
LSLVAVAVARGIYFAALMLLFGSAAFGTVLKRRLPIIAQAALPRWPAVLLALIAAGVWFLLATEQMAGELTWSALWEAATATLFGQLFLARVALLLGLALVPRRGHALAALLAGAALVLPSATGHAAASSPAGFTAIGAGLDAIHLLTAGFWIGGLAVLLPLFARKEPNILLALSLFSDWAMAAVLVLAMTGLINAASIILAGSNGVSGGTPALPYLGVLGAKLALVALMLALAAVNHFKLMPRGQDGKIARNAERELGLGLIVVLLAGALGQLSPTL